MKQQEMRQIMMGISISQLIMKKNKSVLLKSNKMKKEIKYSIRRKRDGIYYFEYGEKHMKIKADPFNDEEIFLEKKFFKPISSQYSHFIPSENTRKPMIF